MRLPFTSAQARSGALLGGAHALEAALPFLRSVAMAYLMTPLEFALALTFSTVVAISEDVSEIGLAQLAVRADRADSRRRNTYHSLALIRAMVLGGAIVLLSRPLALLFQTPDATLGFAVCGLALMLKGFTHFGYKQLAREYNYAAEGAVIAAAQTTWTISLIAAALVWHDHRAMVLGLALNAVAFVVTSHLVSRDRYRLEWDPAVAAEAARFGWPLIPSGIARTAISLGDRLIIGSRIGLEALALYGPLSAIAALPRSTALRYLLNLFLPVTAHAVERGEGVREVSSGWILAISLLAIVFGLGFFSLSSVVIAIAFGRAYVPPPLLVTLMSALLMLRIINTYPVPLAIATGRSWFVSGASMMAAASILPATLSALLIGGEPTHRLAWFLGSMVVVETITVLVIAIRSSKAFPPIGATGWKAALATIVLVYGLMGAAHMLGVDGWLGRSLMSACVVAVAVALFGRRLAAALRQYRAARTGGKAATDRGSA